MSNQMSNQDFTLRMRDPTAESSAAARSPLPTLPSLAGRTVALLDIGKERSDEFLDQLALRMDERGLSYRRYAKPDNSKVAPESILHAVATETDIVVEALSD